MVVLEHTAPGKTAHFDWLIDVDGHGPLLSLRTHTNPVGDNHEFPCESAPAHRRVYLTFEGELSEGRGSVRRVATGTITRLSRSADVLSVEAVVEGKTLGWRIERLTDAIWIAHRQSLE